MRNLTAIALASTLAGCSLGMQRLPARWEPSQFPTCSDSKLAPTVDITTGFVLTVVGLAGTAVALWGECEFCGLGALYGVPALILQSTQERCAARLEAWRTATDPRRKTTLLDQMPAECRRLLTAPARDSR